MYRNIGGGRGTLAHHYGTFVVDPRPEHGPGVTRVFRGLSSARQRGWSLAAMWCYFDALQTNTGFLVVEPRRRALDDRFTVTVNAPTTKHQHQRFLSVADPAMGGPGGTPPQGPKGPH